MPIERVRIRLTSDPTVRDALRTRGLLNRDGAGKESYVRTFSGQEFRFRPGIAQTLPKIVAMALKQSSEVEVEGLPFNRMVEALEILAD